MNKQKNDRSTGYQPKAIVHVNPKQLTMNNLSYSRVELTSLTVKEIKRIARRLELAPNGDKRKKETWINAILEAQSINRDKSIKEYSLLELKAMARKQGIKTMLMTRNELEEIFAPDEEPNHQFGLPSVCSECPFARSLGGERYQCTAHRGVDVVYGHWRPSDECHEELEKARDRAPEYEDHPLNAPNSSKINQSVYCDLDPVAVTWFENWQSEKDSQKEWEWQKEFEEATQQMLGQLEVQQQITGAQPTLMEHGLIAVLHEFLADDDILITIWNKSKMFCCVDANIFSDTFVAYASNSDGMDFYEATTLLDAVFGWQYNKQLREVGIV